ncbi:MAG TPA: PDZ domain-containing protein [Pirellulales bacterium]
MCASIAHAQQEDVSLREEAAMKAAVARVAPCVVRIETLGGLETIGDLLVGTGPTTGLIVSSDGYIVSSAFNFIQKPTQILVDLADGTRLPAQVVAHDDSRMIVLLKIPTENLAAGKLQVPVAAPLREMRVGQWTLALGRVFEGSQPNMSVGILSAVNRVWGKAIQTDAKISPSNYGGPLIDLRGRVMGVLVPMSPMESGEVAGVEWYDSGIGFAVPLEHINRVLDRLKKGEDLHPGLLGISLKSGDPYADAPVISSARPKSPAAEAGLKPGDKVVEIDGVKISSLTEMKHQLGPHYAGDKVTIVVLRDKDRMERTAELVAKLRPYIHPFLGILPRRDNEAKVAAETAKSEGKSDEKSDDSAKAATAEQPQGVVIRDIYAGSPAAEAGLQAGDKIISLDGKPVKNRVDLQEQLSVHEPLEQVKVEFAREGKSNTVTAKLATLPEAVPAKLPPAHDSNLPLDAAQPALGRTEIKIPEAPNGCLAYVPENYNSHIPYALVVWLHPPGGFKADDLVKLWKPICDANDFILLAPKSADPARWQRTEMEFIRKEMDDVVQKYNVDPARVVVVGQDVGGTVAYYFGSTNRDLVRGIAAINAALPSAIPVPESDPVQRLAIFSTSAKKSPPAIAKGVAQLREAKHPVTEVNLGEEVRPLTAVEYNQLARWIDSLDHS